MLRLLQGVDADLDALAGGAADPEGSAQPQELVPPSSPPIESQPSRLKISKQSSPY